MGPDAALSAVREASPPHKRAGFGSRKAYNESLVDELQTREALATMSLGAKIPTLTQYMTNAADSLGMSYTELLQDDLAYAEATAAWAGQAAALGVDGEEITRWQNIQDAIQNNLEAGMSASEARADALRVQERADLNAIASHFARMMGAEGQIRDGVFELTSFGDDPQVQLDFNRIMAEAPAYLNRGYSFLDTFELMMHDFGMKLKSLPVGKQVSVEKVPGIATAPDWVRDHYDFLPPHYEYQWTDEAGLVGWGPGRDGDRRMAISGSSGCAWT